MSDYADLGSRQVTAAADLTGLNTGNLTNAFTVGLLPGVAQYEIYHAAVTGAPAGASAVIVVDGRPISFTAPGVGGGSEWDPNQAPIVRKGQEIDFLWTTPAPAQPAVTRGQVSSLLAATDGGTMTWATNPAAGQKVIVVLWTGSGETVTSVTDNGTTPSTFTLDASNAGPVISAYIYRADNITLPASGSYAVTVAGSGAAHIVGGGIAYSGARTGGPTATSTGSGTGSAVSTGPVIAAASGALYVAGFVDDSSLDPETITLTAAGFTQEFIETNGNVFWAGAAADKIDSGGPASTACTWTLGDAPPWAGVIAVYDAAPATSGGTPVVTLWLRYDTTLPGNR